MKLNSAVVRCIIACSFLASCQAKNSEQLFRLKEDTGVDFVNAVADSANENNCFIYRNYYNGGGVAAGDLDNDGLPDLVFTSNLGSNKIYANKGGFRFEDKSPGSGLQQDGQWSTGVSLVDINNDGWLDIYIGSAGHVLAGNRKNRLYINQHNFRFKEAAAEYGLDHSGYSTQAAFFDYDGDGDLDCFIMDNSPIPFGKLNYANMRDSSEAAWKVPDMYKGGGNHLYRNDNSHFVEVTKDAGLHTSLLSFGLGLSIADFNGDGWPDIYVGNDFLERDYLYINQKNGRFSDELEERISHTSMSSMGTDVADMNNDGLPDLYSTDMLPYSDYRLKTTGTFDNVDLYQSKVKSGFYQQYVRNCLQMNRGNGHFYDVANYTGTAATDWSWGLVLFDADNDGLNDIFVCNGINRDLSNLDFLDFFSNDFYHLNIQSADRQVVIDSLIKTIPRTALPNKVFKNRGQFKYEDAAEQWGLAQPSFSNSAAYADLDNDGDLDLVVNNENQPAFIYQNNSSLHPENHFISFSLMGGATNRFAIGTIIKVYAAGQVFYREMQPVRGFQSCMMGPLVVGLGTLTKVDSVKVFWPDHSSTVYQHPAINQLHQLKQTDGHIQDVPLAANDSAVLLKPIVSKFDKHREDDYVDFYYERNIPEMLSRQGPHAAVGDVNGDGYEDVYIGGASGQAGQLYLQSPDGNFTKKVEPVFDVFAASEDIAARFFDADGDGDLDLVVGPGGNNQPPDSREMQLRLLVNDGKGNFTLDANAFPPNRCNISTIIESDFDHDGDVDLFVGALSIPGNYGAPAASRLLVNDGHGRFSDQTGTLAPDLLHVGMVTAAAWADLNGDGKTELVVVGEWMSPKIYTYNKGQFSEQKTNLENLQGWWQTVAVADLDGDGKKDLVLGNIGENFYLRPGPREPVRLWMADFDRNGTVEKVMTQTIDGKDMPVFLKHEMEDQLPLLKKQSLLHDIFAKKSIQELLPADILANCPVLSFNYPASCVAWNKGNGQFELKELPAQAQFSSVNAILLLAERNKLPGILLGGNKTDFLPQFGRLDANPGLVLANHGNRNLEVLNVNKTGLEITGETMDMQWLQLGKEKAILFLRNNDFPVLCKIVNQQKLGWE